MSARLTGRSRHAQGWRVVAELSARALVTNYRVIRSQCRGERVLPMIKADAYGHGMTWAARELLSQPGLEGFGVATLEEGAALRAGLGSRALRTRILVFSGTVGFSDATGQFCERHGLTPVIAQDDDWRSFSKSRWISRIPYELKFNTGMNRLGLSLEHVPEIARFFSCIPSRSHPRGILSHLAVAEEPRHELTRLQLDRFWGLQRELSGRAPGAAFHLANSAGIWNLARLGLQGKTQIVRPGISLYGVPPWLGAPARGLKPVMALSARVLAVHELSRGESVGYGATFRVARGGRVAIVAAGYADGFHRAWSNRGLAWIDGRAAEIAGIVSMDLCALSLPKGLKARPGTVACFLGPGIDPWVQARAAETIPYELFTSLSSRVVRTPVR